MGKPDDRCGLTDEEYARFLVLYKRQCAAYEATKNTGHTLQNAHEQGHERRVAAFLAAPHDWVARELARLVDGLSDLHFDAADLAYVAEHTDPEFWALRQKRAAYLDEHPDHPGCPDGPAEDDEEDTVLAVDPFVGTAQLSDAQLLESSGKLLKDLHPLLLDLSIRQTDEVSAVYASIGDTERAQQARRLGEALRLLRRQRDAVD